MDCGFNINHVLPEEMTVIDADADFWKNTSVGGGRDYMRQQIGSVIDRIGEASAQSQGLLTAITNATKLRTSDHRLYILKDASANQFRGGVIGYMKVAKKKLFLHDPVKGTKKEYEPLCILDFYIDVPYQRQGYGTKIFNYALQRERTQAQDVAFDRPSPKLLSFLARKFNLVDVVRQPSHFVVFSEFFTNNTGKPWDPSKENGSLNGPTEKAKNGFYQKSLEKDPMETPEVTNGNGVDNANGYANGYTNGHGNQNGNGVNGNNQNGIVKSNGDYVNGKPSVPKTGEWDETVGGHLRQTTGRNLHYQHTQLW